MQFLLLFQPIGIHTITDQIAQNAVAAATEVCQQIVVPSRRFSITAWKHSGSIMKNGSPATLDGNSQVYMRTKHPDGITGKCGISKG